MATDLVTLAEFPADPGRALGQALMEHVRRTAQPETFPNLSTTRPPDTGSLVVLAYPISVDRACRPKRDGVACSVCAPDSPKWLTRGSLIWCADTQAIYLVGPTCSSTGWAAARLAGAQNTFLQSEKARLDAAQLAAEATAAPGRIDWAVRALPIVARSDEAQATFARLLPITRRALASFCKTGLPLTLREGVAEKALGRLPGDRLFLGLWRDTTRLQEARRVLEELQRDAGDDSVTWAASLAPTLRSKRLKLVRGAADQLASIREHVGEAASFMSAAAFDLVAAWIRGGGAPTDVRCVARTALGLELEEGTRERWRGRAGGVTTLTEVPRATLAEEAADTT